MDWVKALWECSLENVWSALRERIQSDVAQYAEHSGDPLAINVALIQNRFRLVRRSQFNNGPWATVELRENYLLVRKGMETTSPDDVEEVRLVPIVNGEGECRLQRGEEELELWQASRLVLEPLMTWREWA